MAYTEQLHNELGPVKSVIYINHEQRAVVWAMAHAFSTFLGIKRPT